MLSRLCIVFTLHYAAVRCASGEAVPVFAQCAEGTIEGRRHSTASGNTANVFLSVPYANARRFAKPEPPLPYVNGVWNGTRRPPACVQFDFANEQTEQRNYVESERCLLLNILAPTDKVTAIILWVHGGFYRYGSQNDYSNDGIVDSFVSRNVLFVAVQYRLGPLGFLHFGGSSGNLAHWDLIAAVKWLAGNKAAFLPPGTDAHAVPMTLMGESAGGMLVSLVDASQQVSDHISGVIIMSGSSLRPGAVNGTMNRLCSAKLAAALDCELPSPAHIVDCLRTRSVPLLKRAFLQLAGIADQGRPFPSVIDGELLPLPAEHDGASTDDRHLLHAMLGRSGTPTLIGATGKESAFAPCLKEATVSYDEFRSRLKHRLDIDDGLQRRLAMHQYVHTRCDRSDDEQLAHAYAEMIDDWAHFAPAQHEATLRAKGGAPVWLYDFDYPRDEQHGLFARTLPQHCRGPFHAIDLAFAFRSPFRHSIKQDSSYTLVGEDLAVADAFVQRLCDFATHRNPDPDWPRVTPDTSLLNLPYMHFARGGPKPRVGYKRAAAALWHSLLPDVRRSSADCAQMRRAHGASKGDRRGAEAEDDEGNVWPPYDERVESRAYEMLHGLRDEL